MSPKNQHGGQFSVVEDFFLQCEHVKWFEDYTCFLTTEEFQIILLS